MVSFTHLDRGTEESRWAHAIARNAPRPTELRGVDRLIVIAAHPDDESLGAGGLIATAAEQGVPVHVVVATAGEASHRASPTHSPDLLRSIRHDELEAAMRLLAPHARTEFLDLPDGQLAAHAPALRERLDTLLDEFGDERILLVAPWHGDGHGDHEAAGAVARAVSAASGARLLEYPIWLWHWAAPDDPAVPWREMTQLQLSERAIAAKRDAMAAHRSQTAPLSTAIGDEALLSPEFQAHFTRRAETFVESREDRGDSDAASLPEEFFDDFYGDDPDPWGFESRWYERRKRALTLGALPRERFGSALEVGCSTGVLTAELAERCDHVLGIDISEAPLRRARRRSHDDVRLDFARFTTPDEWPDGVFDLIVLSEVGYYWGVHDLSVALDAVVGSLAADGVVVACHWRHPVAGYPLDGDAVHEVLNRDRRLARTVHHLEEDFVLEVFEPPPAVSVARADGLLS